MKRIIFLISLLIFTATVVYPQSTTKSESPTSSPSPLPETCERFYSNYQKGILQPGEECDLGLLINRDLKSITEIRRECQRKKNKCPLIVLIDTRISDHPDLPLVENGQQTAVEGRLTVPTPKPTNENHQNITISGESGVDNSDHGTYMAGIIASLQNGFGLIGINPGARIEIINWDKYQLNSPNFDREEFSRDLGKELDEIWRNEYKNKKVLPIFVFTTSWNVASRLRSDEDRVLDPFVRVLMERDYLFIVAAGQNSDKRKRGEKITRVYTDAPMNLGDQRNVIVSTAYSEGEPTTNLLFDANYSDPSSRMVHVAAPGNSILSTVASEGGRINYSLGHGTSPATAIVAAVASIMIAKWPEFFNQPFEIKERLQVISSPILSEQKDIAAGVLNDPSLALMDPRKDLLKRTGNTNYLEINEGEFQGWGTAKINVFNADRTRIDETISTKDIYRIYKRDRKWVIYTRLTDCSGSKCDGHIVKTEYANIDVPSTCDPKTEKRDPRRPVSEKGVSNQSAQDAEKNPCRQDPLFFAINDRGVPESYNFNDFTDFLLHAPTSLLYSFTGGQ